MSESWIENEFEKISNNVKISNKKILVTGGAGFLGSWVCDVLLYLDNEVICVDNLSTGLTGNIDDNIKRKNFQFVKKNVTEIENEGNYDYILHMASRASPEEYQEHPIETLEANSFGTKKILEIANQNHCPLLYTSTSEVYGDADIIPTPETYWGKVNPVGIRSCYDEAKRFSEALIVAYQKEYKVNSRIVRIFNTYGPRIRMDGAYARALPRFCFQALTQENITVFGDGKQTRSFCFVTDTIKGILLTLTKENARNEIINIGNPNEITILELAEKIIEITDSKSKIIFQNLPEDDPKRRCPIIKKAELLLDWKPTVDLELGLTRTIDWIKTKIT